MKKCVDKIQEMIIKKTEKNKAKCGKERLLCFPSLHFSFFNLKEMFYFQNLLNYKLESLLFFI